MNKFTKTVSKILCFSMLTAAVPYKAEANMLEQKAKIYQTQYNDYKSFMNGFTDPTGFLESNQSYVSNNTFSQKIKFDLSGEEYKEFITASYAYITEQADSDLEPELYLMPEHLQDDSITPFNIEISIPGQRIDTNQYKKGSYYRYVFDITDSVKENLYNGQFVFAYNLFNNSPNGMRITANQSDGFIIENIYMTGSELLDAMKKDNSSEFILKCIGFALGEKVIAAYNTANDAGKQKILNAAKAEYNSIDEWKNSVINASSITEKEGVSIEATDIAQLETQNGVIKRYNAEDTWVGAVASQKIRFDLASVSDKKFIKRAYIDFKANADSAGEPDLYFVTTVYDNIIEEEEVLNYNIASRGMRTDDLDYIVMREYGFSSDISRFVDYIIENDGAAFILYNPLNSGIRIKRGSFIMRIEYATYEEALQMYYNGGIDLGECISYILGADSGVYYNNMTDNEKEEIKQSADILYETNALWRETIKNKINEINGSADASMSTALTNTNQDIIFTGVEGRSLSKVAVNQEEISSENYSYDENNYRLTIDKSIFATSGIYDISVEFTGSENKIYTLLTSIDVKEQYIYKNNFDEYTNEELAGDPIGQELGSSIVGLSEIAPEWSLSPYTARYNGDEFRNWAHADAGKLQNRIVEYSINGVTTKGLTLDMLDETLRRPASVLDLDRVYKSPVNKTTIGSDKVNLSYKIVFGNYENNQKPVSIAIDNCIDYGSWNTSVMNIDPVWGLTFFVNSKNGVNYSNINGYYAYSDKNVNDGTGRNNNGIDWAIVNNYTAKVDMTIDFADPDDVKLYVKIQDKDVYFEMNYGDEALRLDYLPLNPAANMQNYYDIIEPAWMSSFFPYGYDGMTMVKFIKPDAAMQVYIDDVTVQSDVNRVKTIISEVSSYPQNERKTEAKKAYRQYMSLSEEDRANVNNIGLLEMYDLFSIESAEKTGNAVYAKLNVISEKSYKAVCMIYSLNDDYVMLKDKSIIESKDIEGDTAVFTFDKIDENDIVKVMLWEENMEYPLCDYAAG